MLNWNSLPHSAQKCENLHAGPPRQSSFWKAKQVCLHPTLRIRHFLSFGVLTHTLKSCLQSLTLGFLASRPPDGLRFLFSPLRSRSLFLSRPLTALSRRLWSLSSRRRCTRGLGGCHSTRSSAKSASRPAKTTTPEEGRGDSEGEPEDPVGSTVRSDLTWMALSSSMVSSWSSPRVLRLVAAGGSEKSRGGRGGWTAGFPRSRRSSRSLTRP